MEKIVVASGPVIVKDKKVLLDIQGDDLFWKFCGGRVQDNETLTQTAVRRAKEELGINIEIKNPEPFLLYTTKEKAGELFDVILAHFLSDFSGDIQPGDEVTEWKWFPLDELSSENLAPNIIPVLKHFGFTN